MKKQTALGHTHPVAKTLTVWSWTRVSQGTRSSNATTGMLSQDLRRRKSQRRGLFLTQGPLIQGSRGVVLQLPKGLHDSSPQVSAPWTWPKPVAPSPNTFSINHLGNESAAWSTPSLGGSQTTWEAMIRSDPSQKFNLAMELVKMISQL